MEGLLFIAGIWLLFWLVPKIYEFFKIPTPSQPSNPPSPSSQPRPHPTPVTTYRPKPPAKKPTIKFSPSSSFSKATLSHSNLSDLHDAFTGAPLNPALGLYQCANCQVYYHNDSVAVLREENAGRCVSCLSTSLVARATQEAETRSGRDFDPDVVTLANFGTHFDRVVTFEGVVHDVKESRSGKDYALMFEHASWTRGLKLVFLRGSIASIGGVTFIKNLRGKRVRVRGLLTKHPIFGPQIMVLQRSMILDIR